MIQITKTQDANASVERVWEQISDLETEHKNWPLLRDVKILRKTINSIEREVKIRRGPMGEAKSVQLLSIDAAKKTTTLKMTKGPMLGTRKIELIELGKDQTKIDVSWEFELKGVPGFAIGFVQDNISEVTEKSLAQIARLAEGRT